MPHNEWDQQGGGLWVRGKKKKNIVKQALSDAVLEEWCVCVLYNLLQTVGLHSY